MRTLVLGGIRSGKSGWAEEAITASGAARDVIRYLATGLADGTDPAWQQRIAVHRQRRPAWWQTVENPDVAAELRADRRTPTLVDDMGGWLTAALDRRGWDGRPVDNDVEDVLAAVQAFTAPLVLVSPEAGLTVVPATHAGRRFADELGVLNQRLAGCCDRVVLVVAGQPVWVKPAAGAGGVS